MTRVAGRPRCAAPTPLQACADPGKPGQTHWLPGAASGLRDRTVAYGCSQWRQRQCGGGGAPSPSSHQEEGRLQAWVAIASLQFCQHCYCLQPWCLLLSHPVPAQPLPPSPSPSRRSSTSHIHSLHSIFFNVRQVPSIPAVLAELTLLPTRSLPRRLLPCLVMAVQSPAQVSSIT